MTESPSPFGPLAEIEWRLGRLHPGARFCYVVAMLSVFSTYSFAKVAITFLASFFMLFAVPFNPATKPFPFVAGLVLIGVVQFLTGVYAGAESVTAFLIPGLKLFCLACTTVVAFSGIGLVGLVRASSHLWRPLAAVVGGLASGWRSMWYAWRGIRETQKGRGIGLLRRPHQMVTTLCLNWFVYMIDLASGASMQLAVRWYGGDGFRDIDARSFGAPVDWVVSVLSLCIFGMIVVV